MIENTVIEFKNAIMKDWYKSLLQFIYSLSFMLFFAGCYKEKALPVIADFSIEVAGNDYSVPVKVKITNNTTGAETYNWTMTGANPATSASKEVGTIQYDAAGVYTIKLEAANQYGGRDTISKTLQLDAAIHIDFNVFNTASYYPDATVQINNTTIGATTYEWIFAGGTPSASNQQQPGNIVFSTPGAHLVLLKVGNGRETYTKDTIITVLPDLVNDFAITWAAQDNDMEVPFTATMQNNCTSATDYNWSFAGANPTTSTSATPSVVYNTAGTYTITLTASNDKKSMPLTKTITLLPNSNLYKFTNVHLGINTAQNTIGSYFSSVLRQVIKSSDVTAANGSKIDFAYFGLNNLFTYNKFLSPDSVQHFTFSAIPNAITTKVINKQETCSCGSSMTAAQFDAMTNDAVLQSTTVNQTGAGLAQFDNTTIPRVVLFKTQDGRKGAVKIKQFINAGQQSYIVCDIKVMKN